jgi:DNA-binding transcriptional regulator YiaG
MKEENNDTIRVMTDQEIKNIRSKLELSQKDFCIQYGLSIGTFRNWEQAEFLLILLRVYIYSKSVNL